jgi:hypothetical protein
MRGPPLRLSSLLLTLIFDPFGADRGPAVEDRATKARSDVSGRTASIPATFPAMDVTRQVVGKDEDP